MRIGVDVDGVLTELFKYVKKQGYIFAKKNNFHVKYRKDALNTIDGFGWSKDVDRTFWYDLIWPYSVNCKCKRGASKYLHKLKNENNQIIIITRRHYAHIEDEIGLKMRKNITDWFDKHNIPYDEIHYVHSSHSKIDFVKLSKIDIMIDDSVENLEEISQIIPVICMHSPFNCKYKNDNMIRCYNWKEIYKAIKKIQNEK